MPPSVVFLHGFTHTGASWQPVIQSLRRRYRVLAPDIRGHGSASTRRPVTLPAVIADVAKLPPPRFDLCGYSMGGRLALHVALALRPRVERLVLIGSSPGLADPQERARRREADEELASSIDRSRIEQFARDWERTPLLAGLPPAVAAVVRADRLRNTPGGLACALRGLGTGTLPSLWDRLGELAVPVTLVVGERDHKFRDIAGQMAERIPQARLEVVPGAGHTVHLEAPQAIAAIIADG